MDYASICSDIITQTSLAVMYADRDGTIRLWNNGAEQMFGFTAAEAIGQNMDLIIPEKHRGKHWDGWTRVMATGETKYGKDPLAVPALRKDGTRISIEFNIVLLRDAEGKVAGAAATIQDVTARWERDKALRARLNELQRLADRMATSA